MLNSFARDIASRFHHRAAFISSEGLNLVADLREIAATDLAKLKIEFETRKFDILANYGFNDIPPQSKPFAFSNGTAIIPIQGLLVNRMSWSSSYATGYNFIRSQLQAAIDDPEVQQIVFDVNSNGGVAAGCGELAQEIYASRDKKPSLAMVDSKAYSAAYYLASAASQMSVTPSGGVGSIGVVAMHVDYSEMLADAGLKVTLIHAGDKKVDGNPYEKLSKRARDDVQADVDFHYGLFTDAVADFRDLPSEDVRSTQAGLFRPNEALSIGLVDAIQTPAEALAGFIGGSKMTQNTGASAAAPATAIAAQPTFSMEDVKREAAAAVAAALGAERTRSSGIRTCEEAKGREKLANHLADNTTMTVDEAKAILAASPKEEANSGVSGKQSASGFSGAMDRTQNPNIKPDGSGDAVENGDDTPQARAGRLLGAYGAATGSKKVIDLAASRAA